MRIRRTDKSHTKWLSLFRQLGCNVQSLHQVGNGCGDALVNRGAKLALVEFKEPKGKLTPDQVNFHQRWPVHVVKTEKDIFDLVSRHLT